MSENGHLRDLKSDPMNARRHNPRNVGMIETSIQRNGFGRPILISSDNVVAAGNATIDAAASAGLENVRIIDSDGTEVIAIRRTDVSSDSPTFTNLALSDNRAAELAEWDGPMLLSLHDRGADTSALWYDYEWAQATGNTETDDPGLAGVDAVPEQWMVLIECSGETQQGELLERFVSEGLRCRALTS